MKTARIMLLLGFALGVINGCYTLATLRKYNAANATYEKAIAEYDRATKLSEQAKRIVEGLDVQCGPFVRAGLRETADAGRN